MGNSITKTTIIVLSFISLIYTQSNAQCFSQLDKSPHDIVYYRTENVTDPVIKVVYGRPDACDEKVFGTQIPYGKIWRTGSNEATEVKFYKDVMFGNKYVKAGVYVLFTIPNKNYWTIILNKKTDTYGTCFYDQEANVAKIEVPASKGEMLDHFSIAFATKNYGSQMVLAWAKTRVKIPLYTEESLLTRI